MKMMKAMKHLSLLLALPFLLLGIDFCDAGSPREPSETAFYSKSLLAKDQRQRRSGSQAQVPTLHQIEFQYFRSDNAIVLDAFDTPIPTYSALPTGSFVIKDHKAVGIINDLIYQIPFGPVNGRQIYYVGDLEGSEKEFVEGYSSYALADSFNLQGYTPSRINLTVPDDDFALMRIDVIGSEFAGIPINSVGVKTTEDRRNLEFATGPFLTRN